MAGMSLDLLAAVEKAVPLRLNPDLGWPVREIVRTMGDCGWQPVTIRHALRELVKRERITFYGGPAKRLYRREE